MRERERERERERRQWIIYATTMSQVVEKSRGTTVERENSRPITSWHVTLPSPQNSANYKAPRIAARFCYHYSEANGNLPSVMQKPITHQRTCKQWHNQPRTCK